MFSGCLSAPNRGTKSHFLKVFGNIITHEILLGNGFVLYHLELHLSGLHNPDQLIQNFLLVF